MQSRIPQDIERQAFDLIMIGAGINGAGVARDAAMRGLQVLLLDKGDISSGTTQWATRLIHGGLRYLEHYEFALVRESLRDREAILRVAPRLVKPLASWSPSTTGARGPLMVRFGILGARGHERIRDVGDYQPDRAGALSLEVAGQFVRPVAQPLHYPRHPNRRRLVHGGFPVHDSGDRLDRDPRLKGNVS